MASLETEGKTVEEAVQSACDQLNVPREKLEIEVLNAGSTGIFGLMGSKKARIRATIKEEIPAPAPAGETAPDPSAADLTTDPEGVGVEAEEIIAEAKSLTQGLLDRMGLEVSIQVRKEKESIHILINGDKSGLLIGRRGQTLDALQYLITRMINRKGLGKIRVVLDSGDYRNRRQEYLEDLALKMAAKAKQSGKPVVISPLNAHDRRLVHLILEKDKSIKTISRGEGPLKKIVIFSGKKEPTEETLPSEGETE
ncbi:MAG: RNA-binding cell elongation regulator Jag/EloR [Thermodesulfobacteriota bacterium]